MAAPVTQESSMDSEKISMTAPVSEEKMGRKFIEYHLPCPRNTH